MITKLVTAAAACGAIALAAAPTALAAPGGNGGGSAGGGGGAGGGQASCQIKQLTDTPALTVTSAAIDTTIAVTNCPSATWTLSYLNTATGTTDFTAAGTLDAAGTGQVTVHAAPLPYNYPYRITLTVKGTAVTNKTDTVFTPKPKD